MKIGIFGRTNVGKSTLLNAITGQNVAIVSPEPGTTTDPVRRAYEMEGVGKVTLIDTAGFDDTTPLAAERLKKTISVIDEIDVAMLVLKGDGLDIAELEFLTQLDCPIQLVRRGYDVKKLISEISGIRNLDGIGMNPLFGSQLKEGGTVILVCPIDRGAPRERLILPQVQALRAALDLHATAIVVQPTELPAAMDKHQADLIVTDSQTFGAVETIVAGRVPLTSFSILLAAQKGDIEVYTAGLEALDKLTADSRILLIEHCSHGVSCEDIARVKIPALIEKRFGFRPTFEIVNGRDPLPDDLELFTMAVQCGGCMTTVSPIHRRINRCRRAKLPITNYGMLLKALQ